MTYRATSCSGTILRFLPMVTTILLWKAIYEGSGQSSLAGFSYREMIAYLLLTHISRMFSSMPGLAGGIARDIREGTLKRYLIQPIDMIGYLLVVPRRAQGGLHHHVVPPLRGRSSSSAAATSTASPTPLTLAAYAVSLILAFLVGFFFEASVGMVGFWFLEVTSLLYIVMTLELLHLGPHAAAGPAAAALGGHPQGAAVPVHGLFPGRRLPGQGHGLGPGLAPAARAVLGGRLHGAWPRLCTGWA